MSSVKYWVLVPSVHSEALGEEYKSFYPGYKSGTDARDLKEITILHPMISQHPKRPLTQVSRWMLESDDESDFCKPGSCATLY